MFIAAVLFRLLGLPAMLLVSWLLGEVIDTVTVGELAVLWRLVVIAIVLMVTFFLLDLGFYKTRAAFLCKAVTQYKEPAFKNLSKKGISAFAKESTGRYLSVLTNDVGTIEESFLNNIFELIAQPLMFLGSLVLLCWYSLVFFIGAYLALRGDITAGTVLVFVNLANSLIGPIQTIP